MSVSIELPEDISRALESEWGDVPRRTLEALAAEGYRSRALSESQVRRMLGFETRIEAHEFLKKSGVLLDYSESDLEHDIETHKRLGILPGA
jgi:hypothetical protein